MYPDELLMIKKLAAVLDGSWVVLHKTWSVFGEGEGVELGSVGGAGRVGVSLPVEFNATSWLYFCFNFSPHEESAMFILLWKRENLDLSFVIYRADVKF